MMKYYIIICLLAVCGWGCNSDNDEAKTTSTQINSMLIAQENLYGGGSEGFAKEHMVITDATTWQNVMNQMNSVNTVTESFVETDIDFDAYQIIAAFDEVKGNGGHLLEIRLMPGPDQVSVSILDSAPQGNATTVITQPFCILKMTKTDLPIVFE